MRAVSFLDKVEYEFVGNFLQHAICLGDVDNDKNIELVAGNLQGDLAVFKFQQPRPWALASNLGAVAAVIVGDILNDSQNKVLSISCDGWCHMFALQADTNEDDRKQLQPFHSQRLPANTKMALLADINRNTKFNASVLNEVDSNNDPISRWCKSGTRNTDAFCILCNCTISCAQHGAAAVKRHAGMKKHIDAAARHRDKDGNLLPPKLVQGTLDFSNGSANTSLEHQVSKAETTFALSVVAKGIPFSWGDTATSIYHCMFPDSDIAKKFSCGRIKLARIVSDGLGPYFKGQVVTELCQPNVYFSIMIDETPKPELRVQQLDVLVRYFSSSQQEVVVEHVQSFDLGRATAEIIVGCIEEAIADLPKQGLVCFFSDGPNVMKSVRNKLQKHVAPSLIDIGNCNLHKVHNAFGRGLDAFGLDVEEVVRNIYYYFKGAVRAEALRECQDTLGISCHVFLRHVSNRWLTLQDSLCRVEEQFEALRTYFFKGNSSRQRPDTQSLHNKLVSAFLRNNFWPKCCSLRTVRSFSVDFSCSSKSKSRSCTYFTLNLLF
ncbi:hypothetical protein HPB51_010042 [Rhipicephalus microplus]|uniref:Uncharacterized protein n=1 Tax=Rhipicephalus microplus TaxID=6941 RepID=A0A9J6DV67_RHIMP|nr:hypothetical protein HPB51_010042 [Rhipicephalus microplus]